LQFLISRRFGFSEEAMESPEGWDLLISSLAVCDLQKPAAVWAFLALQGLVRNEPADRIAFFKIVEKVRTKSPSTNSSRARRVAERLRAKRLALPAGDAPDPKGELALERRHLMDMWAKSSSPSEYKPSGYYQASTADEFVQEMRTLCNACFTVYRLGDPHQCPAPREAQQTNRHQITVICETCSAVNRADARFCRGCGNHFSAIQSFNWGDSQPSSPPEHCHIEEIWEGSKCESQPSPPTQESERCLVEVMNIIRDLWTASGELKKKA
jgi:hypothetical protein